MHSSTLSTTHDLDVSKGCLYEMGNVVIIAINMLILAANNVMMVGMCGYASYIVVADNSVSCERAHFVGYK